MSGTEVSGAGADKISHDVADNPLFYVDGTGDTAFGRSVGTQWQKACWSLKR